MKIMAVDPGLTTGWCLLNTEIDKAVTAESKGLEETFDFLDLLTHPDIFVVEDYKIRPVKPGDPGFNHRWNTPIAVIVIGAIQFHCWRHGIEYETQQPTERVPGYAWAGLIYKKGQKKKTVHMDDAKAHAYKYAVDNKLVSPQRS